MNLIYEFYVLLCDIKGLDKHFVYLYLISNFL
jgi:hypothetical protein